MAVIGLALAKVLPLVALMVSTGHGGKLTTTGIPDIRLLSGLKGVYVLLVSGNYRGGKGSDPDTPLIEAEFQTLVELKLRQSGIQVVEMQARLISSFYPKLLARVDNMVRNGMVICCAQVSLNQWCDSPTATDKLPSGKLLPWSGEFLAWGPTGSFGMVRESEATDSLKRTVGGLVDQFCNDWLKANPKN